MGAWEVLFTTILQSLLARCQSRVSSEPLQEYARANYDPTTGRIDPQIVEEAMPNARVAAIRARRQLPASERRSIPRLSRQDLYEKTEAAIVAGMNASDEEVASCMEIANKLGPDE